MFDAEFRILGPLECWARGKLLRVRGDKRQAVLGVLLLADGKQVSLGRLIDAVWDQKAPTTATKQIRNAVSDLRGILANAGSSITPAGDGYQLDIGTAVLDVNLFAQRAAHARQHLDAHRLTDAAAEFRAALSLWRGPVLAGLDSPALQAEIVSLNEQRLAALEEWVDLEFAEGRHEWLAGELTRWVAEYPFRERLAGQLLLALYRSDGPGRALAAYDEIHHRLEHELGVAPGPELRNLRHRITHNDPALSRPTAVHPIRSLRWNNFPGDAGHLAGRTAELRRVTHALLAHDAHRGVQAGPPVIAIDGMAGVGKTALALHLGNQLASSYPDGQLFVDLRGGAPMHRPLDPSAALARLLRATGVPTGQLPPSFDERRALWQYRLADRRVLLVLDDVADTVQIRPLLPGSRNCLTLVTSRQRLTGLHATFHLCLRGLSQADGRELFRQVVGDERVLAERDAVDAVLQQCGGLPLAVRIAALRLRHRPGWSVGYLASRLANDGRRLAELVVEDSSVVSAFDLSYRRLAPDRQRLFRTLGTMSGPAIEVADVAQLTGLSARRAEQLLEELVDAHLLEEVAPGRYHLHELLRDYARQLADDRHRAGRSRYRRDEDAARTAPAIMHLSAVRG